MRIASIETRRYRVAFDPPFRAAWDPVPRTGQDATLVIVTADDGTQGFASGDASARRGRAARRSSSASTRVRTEVVRELVETVDFHGGRGWILEVAVWDLVGRALDTPLWQLLGGRSERLLAYASSGELVAPEERAPAPSRCATAASGR